MDDELDAQAVLELIVEHLDAFNAAGPEQPEGRAQLSEAVRAAIADHPDDVPGQAAAALGVVAAYGTLIDQEEFDETLSQLRRVEGLQSIQDVHYLIPGPREEIERSLRGQLPKKQDIRLDENERMAISRFIGSALDWDFEPPENQGGGPRP
ncbi:hypothetical protein WG628_09810 [Stenotrophomonas maltophilia]